jgi:hypothetical protein
LGAEVIGGVRKKAKPMARWQMVDGEWKMENGKELR